MNSTLALLLSPLYSGALAPAHRADLATSGLTDATIETHAIRSIPPGLIDALLGFPTTRTVRRATGPLAEPTVGSAYLLPYPDSAGGWMDYVRLKVIPSYTDQHGRTVKYLGAKAAPPRLYFPIGLHPPAPSGGRTA
jgi:hypothetical protein